MELVFCWIRRAGDREPSPPPSPPLSLLVVPLEGGGLTAPLDCPLRGRDDVGAACAGGFATAPALAWERMAPFDCPFLGRPAFVEETETATGAVVPSALRRFTRPLNRCWNDSEEPCVFMVCDAREGSVVLLCGKRLVDFDV